MLIISVEEIVSDFERALFKAAKKCFPGVYQIGGEIGLEIIGPYEIGPSNRTQRNMTLQNRTRF
jgi:hypothetical protein